MTARDMPFAYNHGQRTRSTRGYDHVDRGRASSSSRIRISLPDNGGADGVATGMQQADNIARE